MKKQLFVIIHSISSRNMIKLLPLVRVSHRLRLVPSTTRILVKNGLELGSGNIIKYDKSLKNFTIAQISIRNLSSASSGTEYSETQLDKVTYERVCSETLESLCDYFEELIENANNLSGSDVSYSDGVLTIKLGSPYGTYVINRQTPNKQIWLSSPTSGPKRYDFVGPDSAKTGKWIYRHNGEAMHELLQRELKEILQDQKINFFELAYGK